MRLLIFKVIKRCFDIFASLFLFFIMSPVFIFLAVLVRMKLGSPIFFRQIRSGRYQRKFYIVKFRTMTNAKDAQGNFLPDEQRQTKFGVFLRSTSLDELPELLSIIKGDMSVIGPRPLPPLYDDYYTEREKKRFEVRGGLLPPDSVEHSAIISWDEQLEYEAQYAEQLSLINDLKIFFSAIKIIFTREEMDYGKYVRLPLSEEREKNAI